MEISLLVAVAGLIISPASAFIAIKIQTEVLKVQLGNLSYSIERLDKDTRTQAEDNRLQEKVITQLLERVNVLEREISELKKRESSK